MAFTVRVQAIKPGALKVKQVQLEIEKALVEEAKVLQRELKRTTETWKGDKPTFDYRIQVSSNRALVHCFPHGLATEKWRRIDEGTEGGYPIRPKRISLGGGRTKQRRPMLVFQSAFSPKTTPGQLQSRAGGKSGPYDVRAMEVIHSGVTARNFSETLGKQEEEPFAERIQKAVDRGLG